MPAGSNHARIAKLRWEGEHQGSWHESTCVASQAQRARGLRAAPTMGEWCVKLGVGGNTCGNEDRLGRAPDVGLSAGMAAPEAPSPPGSCSRPTNTSMVSTLWGECPFHLAGGFWDCGATGGEDASDRQAPPACRAFGCW